MNWVLFAIAVVALDWYRTGKTLDRMLLREYRVRYVRCLRIRRESRRFRPGAKPPHLRLIPGGRA